MSKAYIFMISTVLLAFTSGCAQTEARETACNDIVYQDASYTVCEFDAKHVLTRLFLNDPAGIPYGNFSKLANALEAKDQDLLFAMNGGMYHQDRSAVGFYVENGNVIQKSNTNKGPGNFHLLPNGIFMVHERGVDVLKSDNLAQIKHSIEYATQSGPMLVIDGKLHPKFDPKSTSLNIRNGVGIDGDKMLFAISNEKVNFHSFASLFKDHLNTPNALFLDGAVSKLYAPELKRNDSGVPMGPIIAITAN